MTMAGEHDNLIIRYSEGRQGKDGKHNRGKVTNKACGWGQFRKIFEKPTRTAETVKQFDKLSQDEQHELKAIDGYIMGARMKDGVRRRANVQPRDMVSFDYDHMDEAFVSRMKLGALWCSDKEFFVHTTRRHRKGSPRIRMFVPLARPVSADEYGPISRILAYLIEDQENPMPLVDYVSFRPAQLMYKPTASKDGEYWTYHNTGDLVDPDDLRAWFQETVGDPDDYAVLPRTIQEGDLRKAADKAEDPTTKRGPVGDWCRAYDVIEVIDKFLSDKYARADDHSNKPRYSYLLGTSSSGAVVEDDGLFLYSHHGSDPCAEMLVNAFDLVRIHMFGDLDENEPKETPANKMPSYKAMVEFAREDEGFRQSQLASRYDIAAMFEDVVDEDGDSSVYTEDDDSSSEEDAAGSIADKFDDLDEDAAMDAAVRRLLGSGAGSPADNPKKPKRKKAPPSDEWFPLLTQDKEGGIASTMPNAAIIVHNDPRMFGAIAFNEFSKQIVSRRSILSKLDFVVPMVVGDTENGDPWQDFNDVTIRSLLEAPNGEGKRGYGMKVSDRDLTAAISLASRRNAFHPIRDMLNDAADTYGPDVELLETVFIRYLGVEDNAYHRETAKLVLVASVARIFEPGHKFDFAPILQGATGIRKSSFIKVLYGSHYFGEIDCNLADTQAVAELIAGVWGGELSELAGFHKADHNSAKSFMRRTKDKVRMAYDRRVSVFDRQMIVWGSTNDKKYLKDPTGNRSYWPILVEATEIDTDSLAENRLRIWGAAVHLYREMREEKPKAAGDLPLYLRDKRSQQEALRLQEEARTEELHEIWAEKIGDWLDEPITLREFYNELNLSPDEKFEDDNEISPDDVLVLRCAFHRDQAVALALKKDRGIGDYQTAQNIGRAIPEVKGWSQMKANYKGKAKIRIRGVQKPWYFREDATPTERRNGYRVVAATTDYSHLI